MSLLNVRLDAEDAQRAKALKRAGVRLSDVVREAIRAEHERLLGQKPAARDARRVMQAIYAAHPDPEDLPPRGYSMLDKKAVRRAIVRKLEKRR